MSQAETTEATVDEEPDKKLSDLKQRLADGDYAVDPQAVADAILRRSRDIAILRAEMRESGLRIASPDLRRGQVRGSDQSECSYPANRLVASTKATPASPLAARPIQLIRAAGSALRTAASSARDALGGAQPQSS